MRGLLGGIATGALVAALGLGTLSVISEPPAGMGPDGASAGEGSTPVDPAAAVASDAATDIATPEAVASAGPADPAAATADETPAAVSSPVGAVAIDAPQAPDLPDEAALPAPDASGPQAPATPAGAAPDAASQIVDTAPAAQPEAMSLDGTLNAPDVPEGAEVTLDMDAPVLPNPQSLPPEPPVNEADLVLSTDPAQAVTIEEPEASETPPSVTQETDVMVPPADDVFVVDLGGESQMTETATETATEQGEAPDRSDAPETEAPETGMPEPEAQSDVPEQPDVPTQDMAQDPAVQDVTPQDNGDDDILASAVPAPEAPRLQLQGGENSLLGDRNTGVTIRRPADEAEAESAAPRVAALTQFAADAGDTGGAPLMSVVLIDDGSMSAASAALAGLPFPVTIALDPADAGAADRMAAYRADGFEVAVLARIPEGALPSDVEVTLASVFSTLPETVAVLDIGNGGLQLDADVTEQAMDILAADGRGFVTASQGLNMASRAAEQAGVPAAVIYRDLDADDQDARVIRRFVDQAAFRARQESGVVLVGRVRPDTLSALILWGAANQGDQVALVPLSAVLNAQ